LNFTAKLIFIGVVRVELFDTDRSELTETAPVSRSSPVVQFELWVRSDQGQEASG